MNTFAQTPCGHPLPLCVTSSCPAITPWQATVQYQTQIVRLRTIIGQMDPRMLKANPLKGA